MRRSTIGVVVVVLIALAIGYQGGILFHSEEVAEAAVGTVKSPNEVVPGRYEPPRDCRRLHFVRGWSHEQTTQIFPRSQRAGGSLRVLTCNGADGIGEMLAEASCLL